MGETKYKSNSHKSKENGTAEEKKITQVTRGKVSVKKEPLSRKISEVFLNDTLENVKSYLIFDVLVPAIKDTFVELVNNGVNMLAYGSPSQRKSGKSSKNYTTYYRGNSKEEKKPTVTKNRHGYNDIIFDSREDALEVKECLEEIVDNYHMVSIADLYEMVGETGSYVDQDYGWYELDNITITRDRDGYRLKLPKAVPFD